MRTDYSGDLCFVIPLKNGGYRFYPFNSEAAHAYKEYLNFIRNKFCGAV